MERFYKFISSFDVEEFQVLLDEHGRDGWRVVNYMEKEIAGLTQQQALMELALTDAELQKLKGK
jgi:hypothetical protein